MSPIEAEQIAMYMHLCKYPSRLALLKVPVNFQSNCWTDLVPLLRQSHLPATVTFLNMGDFTSVFPSEDYLGDSLPIEEVG